MEEFDLVEALVRLSFLVQGAVAEAGAPHRLSLTQVRLIGVLRDREPGMAQLAAHLGLDKSSATGLIDRAERRGLVRRTISPSDRRSYTVSLTPAGHDLARTLEAAVEASVDALAAPLTAREQRQLVRLAATIVRNAPSPVDERAPTTV